MDDLERQLKADAAAIPAEVSPELQKRIAASLQAADTAETSANPARARISSWWISGLTGVACALLLLVLFNRTEPLPAIEPDTVPVASTVPDSPPADQVEFPLRAEAAEFAEPLEDELEKLQSDLEKAREAVEAELRRGF